MHDAESLVWRLTFTPGVGLFLRLLDQEEIKEVSNDEDLVGFLPKWYWNDVKEYSEELPETMVTTNSEVTSCAQQGNMAAHISSSKNSTIGWTV